MIRRNLPLKPDADDWLLIAQREHARLSYELAAAWGTGAATPLVCSPDSDDAALRSVRAELLAAIRLHDEGWAAWETAPGMDPAHARPYNFMEMPPADAQQLWSESIHRCREVGPLAGWIVAGHFIQLQSVRDEDYDQWVAWLAEQEEARDAWLAEWVSLAASHTRLLADQAMFYLRTFDWLSLWLCCQAPLSAEEPDESMELFDQRQAFGPFQLRGSARVVTIDPWPFTEPAMTLNVQCDTVAVGKYASSQELLSASRPAEVEWRMAKPTAHDE